MDGFLGWLRGVFGGAQLGFRWTPGSDPEFTGGLGEDRVMSAANLAAVAVLAYLLGRASR